MITRGRHRDHRLRRQRRPSARTSTSTGTPRAAEKGGYDYFMLKEIAEQPRAVADTLLGRLTETGEIMLDEVRLTDQDLRDVDKIFIVACGTAYHAGMVAKYAIEHWTRIPCEVELASEFRYRDPVLDRSTLVVAISQSGETMDTLMALRHAKDQKARVLAICNTNGSTIPRESDARALHPRRPGDRGRVDQGVPDPARRLLPGRAAPGPGPRHQVRRRGRRPWSRSCRPMPAAVDAGAGRRWSRYGSWPAIWSTSRYGAVHRPARRLPGGAGGRAQAQGARLHARRGLRRRRAQARADRADRARAPRSSASCRRRPAAACCTTRSSRTSRRYAPAAPARS